MGGQRAGVQKHGARALEAADGTGIGFRGPAGASHGHGGVEGHDERAGQHGRREGECEQDEGEHGSGAHMAPQRGQQSYVDGS